MVLGALEQRAEELLKLATASRELEFDRVWNFETAYVLSSKPYLYTIGEDGKLIHWKSNFRILKTNKPNIIFHLVLETIMVDSLNEIEQGTNQSNRNSFVSQICNLFPIIKILQDCGFEFDYQNVRVFNV